MTLKTKEELVPELRQAMIDIYDTAKKECNYNPTRFLEMLHKKGSLETVKYLIHTNKVSSGFTKLWECGRLDLSVEAVILEMPYCTLFSEAELDIAKKRLTEYNYYKAA